MSTAAGISDYLTSPASVVTSKPTKKTKTTKVADVSKTTFGVRRSVPKSQQRIVIDGQVKTIVARFTEEGGIIHQVSFSVHNLY